jgi:hypothetical protein
MEGCFVSSAPAAITTNKKEKQTICAILLSHAAQDTLHPTEIEWEIW